MRALRLDRSARRRRVRLGPKPQLPIAAMGLYRSALRRAIEAQQKRLWAIIEASYVEPKADSIAADIFGGPLGMLSTRHDAPADGGVSKLRSIPIAVPTSVIETVGERVAKKTRDETAKLLGVELKGGRSRRVPGGISRAAQGADAKTLSAWRKRNTDLIKRLQREQVEQLSEVLAEATEKGWHIPMLRARIVERFQVTKSHADLIARDQSLKLNAELTQARHKAAGITEFVWSTSRDERVRESHAALDGQRFSWDDLPDVDGEQVAPGEAISCRCVAVAVVPWLEEES